MIITMIYTEQKAKNIDFTVLLAKHRYTFRELRISDRENFIGHVPHQGMPMVVKVGSALNVGEPLQQAIEQKKK